MWNTIVHCLMLHGATTRPLPRTTVRIVAHRSVTHGHITHRSVSHGTVDHWPVRHALVHGPTVLHVGHLSLLLLLLLVLLLLLLLMLLLHLNG